MRKISCADKCLLDRRKTEKRINSFPNFKVAISDQGGELYDIHFVGLFSENPNAIPIVMLHGWPGRNTNSLLFRALLLLRLRFYRKLSRVLTSSRYFKRTFQFV